MVSMVLASRMCCSVNGIRVRLLSYEVHPVLRTSKQRGPDGDTIDELGLALWIGDFLFEDGARHGFACGLRSPQPGNASSFRDRLRRHRDRGIFPGLLETDM